MQVCLSPPSAYCSSRCVVSPPLQGQQQAISQTQNPLNLSPEVESLRFHEPRGQAAAAAAAAASGSNNTTAAAAGGGAAAAPDVCESFAFQRDAIEFAAWCNGVGLEVVTALQVIPGRRDEGLMCVGGGRGDWVTQGCGVERGCAWWLSEWVRIKKTRNQQQAAPPLYFPLDTW